MLRSVGIPQARAARRRVPVPALRRHAPARDDRHGALLRPAAAHRRRADDGARRDDPGADPRPAARAAARARHGDHADHPRPGRDRRDGRRRRGDVPGPGRRAGRRSTPSSTTRSIPTRRRCCARSRASTRSRGSSCRRSSGSIPHPYNRPPGCPFHPRCPAFIAGRCDATEPELVPVGDGRKVSCFLYEPDDAGTDAMTGDHAGDDPSQAPRSQGAEEVLPDPPGLAAEGRRPGPGRRRRHLLRQPGRDAVAGRRERLRQDDDVALHPARDRADGGRDAAPRTAGR